MILHSIYVAGPMRGFPRWNFDAFDAAEKRWREAGWVVYSPAQIDRALGFDPNLVNELSDEFMRRAIKLDCELLHSCEAIALLPGWQKSSGAAIELALANYLRLDVYDAETMESIKPCRHPWSCGFDAICLCEPAA